MQRLGRRASSSGRRQQTYFRHQSADYVPGSGFVAVAEGVAPNLTGEGVTI